MVTLPQDEEPDWDTVGVLSIVVQGGVFASNVGDLANVCVHWRTLFPSAELILAVSVSDFLATSATQTLAPQNDENIDQVSLSWKRIAASCDHVAAAQPAVPLPPTKNDLDLPNHVNLQIAAAKAGLAKAHSTYVLRVRNDFIFLDRSFLRQYMDGRDLPRGERSLFRERILISWLYTLNPFTVERMPFSFSDWFHLGLLEDVRKLWQIPEMTLSDAVYYKALPHRDGSNVRERHFYSRLGVEQHIHSFLARQVFRDISLELHNDVKSRNESINVLADNFVLCDIGQARAVFDKYKHEFYNDEMRYHCLTRANWLEIVGARDTCPEVVLSDSIATFRATEGPLSIPANLPARQFKAQGGRHTHDLLISTQQGLFFYGPYVNLAGGRYVATLQVDEILGTGAVHLRVTSESGGKALAQRVIRGGVGSDLSVDFSIGRDGEKQLEILCSLEGSLQVALRSVVIAHRPRSNPLWRWLGRRMRSLD